MFFGNFVCSFHLESMVAWYIYLHLAYFAIKNNHVGVSKNTGTPKSSILIGFPIIFTIHFGVPLFSETAM